MPHKDDGVPDPRPAGKVSQDHIATDNIRPASTIPANQGASDGKTVEYRHRPGFHTGELIADRYQIVRFVARGGMGEVYEAEDQTLRCRVALKTIRPEIAADPVAVERFKREINIARRITHPNVSRIYDLGIHRSATETMFLTMEFLSGPTLHSHLKTNGPMTENEAAVIADQIAAGLTAAHEAGVIHRDFKTANVILVNGSGRPRAVVTDFGLARPATTEDGMHSLSDADAVVGTPAYMAPEQVQGLKLTPASDIYSFGIVLYEMVTGVRPFEGDTPLSTAVRRLTELPVPPVNLKPDLDPVWNDAILRCLEREPAARFSSASDVARALRNADTPTLYVPSAGSRTVKVVPRSTRRLSFIALGIALLGVLIFAAARMWPSRQPSQVAAGESIQNVVLRPALAVLGFRNNTGAADADWLSTAVSEMLITELSAGGKVKVASGEAVERAKVDLGFKTGDSLSRPTLERIRNALGVQSVVVGSYTVIGEEDSRLVRIDVRAVDANTGDVIGSSETSGAEGQLFDLVSRTGGQLRQALGLNQLTAAQSVEVAATIPSNPEAVRLYTEGLAKLRSLDAESALRSLTQAAAVDRDHPLVHSALSEAYVALGEEVKARDAAARAVALSTKLGREQKLQVEARFQEAAKEWRKAVELRTSLWESFPDNLDYGLALANAQISAGDTREALATIASLRKLPSPLSADGRIDLVHARAHQEVADFAAQRRSAATAAAKGRKTGLRLLVARARMLEANSLLALGSLPEAEKAVEEARTLFLGANDRGNAARSVELTALIVDRRGDLEGARKLLQQALAAHREVGDKTSEARVLLNIGNTLVRQGRTGEAEPFLDEALATFRQVDAKYPAAVALSNSGMLLFNRGELRAAQKRYHEALTLFSEIGDPMGTATTLTNIAEVLSSRGELEEARKMHSDALAINRSNDDKYGISYDLFRLGEIFVMKGDFRAAHARYTEALALQQEIGDRVAASDTRTALAALAIDEGRATEAEKTAREAEEILRTEGASERSTLSLSVVADALLAQGKPNEALAAAETAWKRAAETEDRRIRFSAGISRARALAASGKAGGVQEALRFLDGVLAEAKRSGFVTSEMDVRLAIGEIELAAGRPTARQRLSSLQKDAREKGFERIARRAGARIGAA